MTGLSIFGSRVRVFATLSGVKTLCKSKSKVVIGMIKNPPN
jgi:hypothetical protein